MSTRESVIHHSVSGHFAIRSGDWKLVLARGSGGWGSPKEKEVSRDAPKAQLYDMSADVGETTNLDTERPDVADRLLGQLKTAVYRVWSTEGPPSANDVPDEAINLWKSGSP